MASSSSEPEEILPKSAAGEGNSSCWSPRLIAGVAGTLGFLVGVLMTLALLVLFKKDVDRGPPTPSLLPPDHLPRHPSKSMMPLAHRQEAAEEMDVPLEYFEAGYHGEIKATDPRNFGPDAWRTLHRFSVGYPNDPTTTTQQRCIDFLGGLAWMIPCPHCGYHLNEFIVFNEKWSGQNKTECRGVCTSPEEICATQMKLVDFFARAHNNVNVNNYPQRVAWTASQVVDAYSSFTFVTQGPVNGKCQLLKNKGETVGLSPDWVRKGDPGDVLKDKELCEIKPSTRFET